MAEQVRVRRPNVALRIPQVRFVAQEAEARAKSGLAQSLQRMSNYFLQQAEQKAQIEGAEYGALQAPTQKQIIDAVQDNEAVELPGDKTTVFGRAARKAALEAASDELQFLAKRKITDITIDAQSQQLAPDEVATEIDTAIAGFSAALDEASPATARALRANLGIYGNAEYEAYTKKFLDNDLAQRKSQFEMNYRLTLDTLPKMFSNGLSMKQQDGSELQIPAPTPKVVQSIKQTLLKQAISFDYTRAEIEGLANDFDAEVQFAARDTVTSHVLESSNPYASYLRIEQNSKGLPENVQAALEVMNAETKRGAIMEARDAWQNSLEDEEKQINFAQARRDETIRTIEQRANFALRQAQSDPDAALIDYQQAVTEMARLDAEKANEMSDLIVTNGRGFAFALETNDAVKTQLDMQVTSLDVNLTLSKLDALLYTRELSYDDWLSYSETVNARMDERFKNALIETRKRLKLPTGMISDASVLQRWQFNALNEIEVKMRRALRDAPDGGRGFDALQWLDENYETLTDKSKTQSDAAGRDRLAGMTRSSVTTRLNAAQTEDEKAYFQELLDLADRLIADGTAVPGF